MLKLEKNKIYLTKNNAPYRRVKFFENYEYYDTIIKKVCLEASKNAKTWSIIGTYDLKTLDTSDWIETAVKKKIKKVKEIKITPKRFSKIIDD